MLFCIHRHSAQRNLRPLRKIPHSGGVSLALATAKKILAVGIQFLTEGKLFEPVCRWIHKSTSQPSRAAYCARPKSSLDPPTPIARRAWPWSTWLRRRTIFFLLSFLAFFLLFFSCGAACRYELVQEPGSTIFVPSGTAVPTGRTPCTSSQSSMSTRILLTKTLPNRCGRLAPLRSQPGGHAQHKPQLVQRSWPGTRRLCTVYI